MSETAATTRPEVDMLSTATTMTREARALTIPGPAPMRGLGTIGNLLGYLRDPVGTAGRIFAEYGPLAALVRAPARLMSANGSYVFLANGAELNRELLTDHDTYHMEALTGRFYPQEPQPPPRKEPLTRMLTGLCAVNGDEHRRHRRLLMPAFHKGRINGYRDDMVALTREMIEGWRGAPTVNLSKDLTRLTLRIATKTLFGEDVDQRGVQVAHWLEEWLVTMITPAMFLQLDWPGLPYRRWLDLTKRIDVAITEILREKRARGATGADMLSMLLQARDEDGSALTENELIGHAGVIFAAGHETSTTALIWTLLLISQHPQVAADLVDELSGELHGEPPTVEQLARLPLLDRVVKESMRVLPPVPLHPRYAARDTELMGHFIPERAEILLSIFHMHHDPSRFPEPRRFRPERWETINPTAFEYNPFSAGPRMCIGAAFATMQIKIALAMILQAHRFAPLREKPMDQRVTITMAPKHGLNVSLHPPDGRWRESAGGLRGNLRELVELPA